MAEDIFRYLLSLVGSAAAADAIIKSMTAASKPPSTILNMQERYNDPEYDVIVQPPTGPKGPQPMVVNKHGDWIVDPYGNIVNPAGQVPNWLRQTVLNVYGYDLYQTKTTSAGIQEAIWYLLNTKCYSQTLSPGEVWDGEYCGVGKVKIRPGKYYIYNNPALQQAISKNQYIGAINLPPSSLALQNNQLTIAYAPPFAIEIEGSGMEATEIVLNYKNIQPGASWNPQMLFYNNGGGNYSNSIFRLKDLTIKYEGYFPVNGISGTMTLQYIGMGLSELDLINFREVAPVTGWGQTSPQYQLAGGGSVFFSPFVDPSTLQTRLPVFRVRNYWNFGNNGTNTNGNLYVDIDGLFLIGGGKDNQFSINAGSGQVVYGKVRNVYIDDSFAPFIAGSGYYVEAGNGTFNTDLINFVVGPNATQYGPFPVVPGAYKNGCRVQIKYYIQKAAFGGGYNDCELDITYDLSDYPVDTSTNISGSWFINEMVDTKVRVNVILPSNLSSAPLGIPLSGNYTSMYLEAYVNAPVQGLMLNYSNSNNFIEFIRGDVQAIVNAGYGVITTNALRKVHFKNLVGFDSNPGKFLQAFYGSNYSNYPFISFSTLTGTSATAPASGTTYQNVTPFDADVIVVVEMQPTSSAAATASASVGPSSSSLTQVEQIQAPAGSTSGQYMVLRFRVPRGYYFQVNLSNASVVSTTVVIYVD